jgi:monothiol glutaredoxin
MNHTLTFIQQEIDTNDVVLFMKGTAETPLCGFSSLVCAILNRLDVAYKDINVLADPELRQAIKDFTDWPTIPQLYIKGEFIGGSDIVKEMYESGELQELIAKLKGSTR